MTVAILHKLIKDGYIKELLQRVLTDVFFLVGVSDDSSSSSSADAEAEAAAAAALRPVFGPFLWDYEEEKKKVRTPSVSGIQNRITEVNAEKKNNFKK